MNYKILFALKKFRQNFGKATKISFASVFFTDRKRCDDLKKIVKNLPKNSAIIFREYDLNKAKRQELALEIFAICKNFGHKFLIGKDLELARAIKADGIHFSDLDFCHNYFFAQKNKKKFIISLACHSLKSLAIAQKSAADIIFLTPIFVTKSHKNTKILGLKNLEKACQISLKPVFALGGVNEKNIAKIARCGAFGFGAIELLTL